MSQSLEAVLHDAIRDNDLNLVTSCLKKGADANIQSPPPPVSVHPTANYGNWVKNASSSKQACMYPLYWAILNCYQNKDQMAQTVKILEALLDYGAEPNSRVSNVRICTVS
jgi:hypothetical protein